MKILNRYTGKIIKETKTSNLRGANLRGADLSGADLSGADLSGTDLYRADLRGAILSGTILSGADLYRADLSEADLSGADLSGANLSGAKNIVHIQFKGYDLWIQKDKTRIGCEYKTNKEWLGIEADEVEKNTNKTHAGLWPTYKMLIRAGVKAL